MLDSLRAAQAADLQAGAGEHYLKSRLYGVLIACFVTTGLLLAAAQLGWIASFVRPFMIAIGGILLVAAVRNWELGVQSLLVVLIFEGAARKWFLQSASEWVYFYKDVLMVASLVGYLTKRNKVPLVIGSNLRILYLVLFAFVLYGIAVVSNPSAPNILVSLFGLKAYCLYMPLAFMVPRMFTTKKKLIHFLRWYLLLSLPVVALGITQFTSSDFASPLNRYAWNEEAARTGIETAGVAGFEDSEQNTYVRVTGTFSYISGLAIYLPAMYALLLGLTSLESLRSSLRSFYWIYYLPLAAVVATAFMTGSRSSIVQMVVITTMFLALTSFKKLKHRLLQLAAGGALIYVTMSLAFPAALNAMETRALGEAQIVEGRGRIVEVFRPPLLEASYAGAFGYGIGATQNSVPAIMSKMELQFTGEPLPIGYEEESERVMLELGIVGYVLHFALRLVLLFTLLGICLAIRDVEAKALAVAAFSVLTIYLLIGGAVTAHTQSVLQWFLIGVCFAALNAERVLQRTSEFRLNAH